MIGYLTGTLQSLEDDVCICLVQGVGYEVAIHSATRAKLSLQQEVVFYIHHHVREDAQTLFGFLHDQERAIFRLLIQASGVGPKLGLTILSAFPDNSLVRVIQNKDIASLKAVKGIGTRVAEKMVVELHPKFSKWQLLSMFPVESAEPARPIIDEVLQALSQLGYQANGLRKKVEGLYQDDMATEVLLRKALQSLV